jgi:hypothetical protein
MVTASATVHTSTMSSSLSSCAHTTAPSCADPSAHGGAAREAQRGQACACVTRQPNCGCGNARGLRRLLRASSSTGGGGGGGGGGAFLPLAASGGRRAACGGVARRGAGTARSAAAAAPRAPDRLRAQAARQHVGAAARSASVRRTHRATAATLRGCCARGACAAASAGAARAAESDMASIVRASQRPALQRAGERREARACAKSVVV